MLTAKLNKSSPWRMPNKLLPILANGLMLALLSYLFYQLGTHILNLMYPENETVFLVDTNNIPKQITVTSGNVSRKIASLHLFGQMAAKKKQAAKKQIVAPATQLKLTLRGIIAEDQKHLGIAIIQQDNKKDEKPFSVKQSVFGLATLEEIYDDRVILLRNGKFETLRLPEDALSREHFLNSAEVKAARKRTATDFRNRVLNGDGEDLVKLFGFDTAYKNGGFIGFTVMALGEEGLEMMEILGIQDHDLITVVNGLRLSESLEALEKLKDLKDATSVDIIIERDGNEIPFHFEFDAPIDNSSNKSTESGSSTDTITTDPVNSDSVVDNPAEPLSVTDTITNTSGSSTNTADSSQPDDDLGVDWDDSKEAEIYKEQQKARTTGSKQEVEFDH
jgi:general secretion pathway protein C